MFLIHYFVLITFLLIGHNHCSIPKRVILAYSGGLDTTCILFWLKEEGYEVVTYTANVGQPEDFQEVKKRALELGAVKAVVEDLREEFLAEYIIPSLAYGAIYQGQYLLGTSLARPCITAGLVNLAFKEGAQYIAHGATAKGNDQVRFELAAATLAPHLKWIVPWRLPNFYERFKGRLDLMEYAKERGFQIPTTPSKPYSCDANLMHISYESGMLEDPMTPPEEDMFIMTSSTENSPDIAQEIEITFSSRGIPTELAEITSGKRSILISGNERTHLLDIFEKLNELGGKHGVGRIDIVEDRYIGMKSRGVYESPGATILYKALRDLETLCFDKEVYKIRKYLSNLFAEQVYNGLWFAPECIYTRSCLAITTSQISGKVILRLFKGSVVVRGRSAGKNSLYDKELVSMDSLGTFTPESAQGFISIQSIRLVKYTTTYTKEETYPLKL